MVGCRGSPAATPEPRRAKLTGGCPAPLTASFSLRLQFQHLDNPQGVSTLLRVPVCVGVCVHVCPGMSTPQLVQEAGECNSPILLTHLCGVSSDAWLY